MNRASEFSAAICPAIEASVTFSQNLFLRSVLAFFLTDELTALTLKTAGGYEYSIWSTENEPHGREVLCESWKAIDAVIISDLAGVQSFSQSPPRSSKVIARSSALRTSTGRALYRVKYPCRCS